MSRRGGDGRRASPRRTRGGPNSGGSDVPVAVLPTLPPPRSYAVYDTTFYKDGYAILPATFPPTRLDNNGNPTQIFHKPSELPDDYYRENIAFLGPLMDRRQRNAAGSITEVKDYNSPTTENVQRFREQHAEFLSKLWSSMPAYFDGVVARAAREDGAVTSGRIGQDPQCCRQVQEILKSLSYLAEEGRYGELMGKIYKYLNRFTREAGDTKWAEEAIEDFARTNGYPFWMASVDSRTKKRSHKMFRLAKSWGSRSALQSLRNKQVKWFGCKFHFRDVKDQAKNERTMGTWRR